MSHLYKALVLLTAMTCVGKAYSSISDKDFAKTAISIGVAVHDLEKSLEFYTHVVGMVPVRNFSVDATKAKLMGLSNGDRFDIKVLKLEDQEHAAEWKLMSFGKPTDRKKQNYIPDTNGIRYVTIFVSSMKPILERIKKYRVKTLGETPVMLDENRQFVLIQDPDGNFIEFIGPAD